MHFVQVKPAGIFCRLYRMLESHLELPSTSCSPGPHCKAYSYTVECLVILISLPCMPNLAKCYRLATCTLKTPQILFGKERDSM